MKHLSNKQQELRRLQLQLLSTLQKMSSPLTENNTPPRPTDWCSTRQLADAHNISIYKARNILLNMVQQGEVIVTPNRVNHTLRWYPSYFERWQDGMMLDDLKKYLK